MADLLKSENIWSSFDGSTSYLSYADNDAFSFTDGVNDIPFEIEFGIRFDDISSSSINLIIGKTSSTINGREWVIQTSSGNLQIILYQTLTTNYIGKAIALDCIPNKNYHIKVVYDGSKQLSGITIYNDNILQTTSDIASGTYTGMVNGVQPVLVGKRTDGYFLNGYLRNLKIRKNNQLVFFAPLQDSAAVSKDVIGGLVHNAGVLPTVVDKLESERWAYFDGTTSQIVIGTASTLGWMNSGTFNIQFEIKIIAFGTNKRVFNTGLLTTQHGFGLQTTTSGVNFFCCNGSAYTINDSAMISSCVLGKTYKLTIKGDGAKYYFTTLNEDGSLNNTNEPAGTVCTYVPFATTSYVLTFGKEAYSSLYTGGLKNFKIYTDTAGTIPFLSLPFQNPNAIAKDVIGGLVGTNTNVRLINNNLNMLKDENKWTYFNGTTNWISYADNDIFTFTDGVNDIPFEVEFDLNRTVVSAGGGQNRVIYKGAATIEWMIDFNVNSNSLRFICSNTNFTAFIQATYTIMFNTNYHFKFTYDGSKTAAGLKIYNNNILLATTNTMTGTYLGMTNTTNPLFVGYSTAAYNYTGYLRNLKITKNGGLVFFSPLTDVVAPTKDVISGLAHNNGTLPVIVNKLETQNWGYFNGVNAIANIGTTSTLGWMNSGVFNIQLDFKSLRTAANQMILSTTYTTASYGFYLLTTNSNIVQLVWTKGVAPLSATINSTAIVLGTNYKITVKGNGTQIQLIIVNNDTGATHYDSGLVSCTYVPNATTYTNLTIGYYYGGSYVYNMCMIKNLKFYTDTAGTVPFLSLPFQNPDAIAKDVIGGLVGTNTNVRLINNNQNVLRSKDLWCKFGSESEGALGELYPVGTTSSFNWMHQTGIFRFEFEHSITDLLPLNNQIPYFSKPAATGNGLYIFRSSGAGTSGRLYCNFGSGTVNIISSNWLNVYTVANTPHKIVLVGNGTGIECFSAPLGQPLVSRGTLNFTGAIVGTGNMAIAAAFGGSNAAGAMRGSMRNFKFYRTSDTSQLVYHFPLTDGSSIGKDVIGGLNGTVVGTLKVVEL